ncbi:EpsG family protein [Acinetobacter lwoffii]|uniref:EpsG family protein n=1 Tax=Acinetobacter lwoffii TaxID=28090 RepID=UPI0035BBCFAF|nr:hypothetical protein ABEDC_0087 [Acinetobacter lwoffii]
MKLSFYKSISGLLFIIIIIIFSFFVASRSSDIGRDTLAYKNYFENIEYYSTYGQYEFGFHYLTYIINLAFGNYFIYLVFLFILINILFLILINNFITINHKKEYLFTFFLFLSLLLLSSWYQVATLNGIRQGLSLVILYVACSFFYIKKPFMALFLLFISLLFHTSTLLILPFLLLIFLKKQYVIYIFFIVSLFYPLGINEKLIFVISSISGLPLYSTIYNYAEGVDAWVGFQLNFYLYSLFFCVFFIFTNYLFNKNLDNNDYILKLFLILTVVYFLFGFGVYSNRFGFMSWLFLPVIQAIYLSKILLNYLRLNTCILILYVLLISGILNFYILLNPLI